ncbi:TPA: lipoate--protein ligase [Staphylococcus aureus]|nr:lipoate--protein ligase [Staphylococcus aureus]
MYLIEPIRNGEYITDGTIALAMQVYVNQHIFLDEDILFPYYCDPKVEIGRFQNTAIEVNQDYIDKHSIQVVRRDTGGGAVYVDKGAVNMCCILEQDTSIYGDFQRFYQPAIKALHTLGATDVVQSGRNDLTLNGKKVSGAAMTLMNNRIYGGYSLLLDVNYEAMDKVLKPNRKKIASKGIKSVRARVGHLREALDEKYRDITIEEFKNLMVTQILGIDDIKEAKRYELTDADWEAIDELADKKYKNWDWNYGKSPKYEYNRSERLSSGTVDITISVEQNRIADCRIYGDFFGQGDIKDVEEALQGTKMTREDLTHQLKQLDIVYYFSNVTVEALVDMILS